MMRPHLLLWIPLVAGCGAHGLRHIEMAPIAIQATSDGLGVDGLTAEEILQQATDQTDRGDLETAASLLRFVLTHFESSEPQATALYAFGKIELRQERYPEALATFDTLVRKHPEAPEALDGLFKRALCYEELGEHRKALRSLNRIWKSDGFDVHDRYTLDLQTGITKVRMGRERAGLQLIERGLAATANTDLLPWLRAKAHITKARVLLNAASTLPLTGREKRVVRNLQERAHLIQLAEKEVTLATRQKEPDWILEGLLLLGEAFEGLGQAIANSPPPSSLSAEAQVFYREQVQLQGDRFQAKAWHHYDEGVALALRVGYRGMRLERLESARQKLQLPQGSIAQTPDAAPEAPAESTPGPEAAATQAGPEPETPAPETTEDRDDEPLREMVPEE